MTNLQENLYIKYGNPPFLDKPLPHFALPSFSNENF